MDSLTVNISWEYFLGIMGSLIGVAYYTSGRFTRIETNIEWLADTIRDLAIRAENVSTKLFDSSSPVSLTAEGRRFLQHSGLKSYVDARKGELVDRVSSKASSDPYAVQESAFHLFSTIAFEDGFTQRLKQFAFANGVSTDLLRRLGAIYLRDIVVEQK